MPKNQELKPELFVDEDIFHSPTVYRSATTRVIEKRWSLIVAYGVITVMSIVASYFTSEWWSVGVTTFVAVITSALGLVMMRDVETTVLEPP